VRIFVALDIPEEVRAALDALITRLRPVSRAVRWTRIEGVHLTLKFIGEVQPEKVEAIEASLAQIRVPHPVEMKFRGVVEVGAELGALASAVETSLQPLGIARERRAFSPHLTLARFKSTDGSALNRLHEAISAAGPLEFGAGIAKDFHLYQSILKPGGAEYTRLATFLFAGGESQ
jgi:RNA 2',3'-cyclic 3'-phosphodiesterase